MPEVKKQDMGRQAAEDTDMLQEQAKDAQTEWDGEEKDLQEQILENFNTVIVETYQGYDGVQEVFLNYNLKNEDCFYKVGCPTDNNGEDFLSRYREWEQTEDWDAALASWKEGHK